jgi:sigma-E factor negative regulatory protein RseB
LRRAGPPRLARLRRAPVLAALGMALVLNLATTASAAEPPAPASVPAAQRSAAQWLVLMQDAARRIDYEGTAVHQRAEQMRSAHIAHRAEQGVSVQRVQMLDGEPMEFIRRRSGSQDEVQCLIPGRKLVTVRQRAVETRFPTMLGKPVETVLRNYSASLGAVERAAGRPAQVIDLVPRDGLRHAYRLWVDRDSGLLLRFQVIEGGNALEQVAFTELRLGPKLPPAAVAPSWATRGWETERLPVDNMDLAQRGWVATPPAGYVLLRALPRTLVAPGGAAMPVIQLLYSDGIAHVSVFIEDAATSPHQQEGEMRAGAMSAVTRRVGTSMVTAVGEVPPAGARAAALSIQSRGPAAATSGGSGK